MNMAWRVRLASKKQAGDTIVEVVLAIAVVSTVLAGAFAVSSHSTQAVRDSEEHAEVLSLLQAQIELLRDAASKTSGLDPLKIKTPFCLDSTETVLAVSPTTPAACLLNISAIQPLSPQLKITCDIAAQCPNSGGTTPFDATVTWTALNGATDAETLSYKVQVN